MTEGTLPARERKILLALVALAYLLRIVVCLEYAERHPLADRPVIDEASYERWALSIAEGDWIGDEVFFQEPLYPYWLGTVYAVAGWTEADRPAGTATYRQRTSARHLQALLGALTVVFVYRIARRLFGTVPAVVAGLAFATYRPLLLMPALLLKPNLFLPVVAWLSWLLLRARLGAGPRALRPWLGAGVLAALGALLRGNMLLLLPFVAVLPFVRRFARHETAAAWPASLALIGGMALVLLPVAVRNQAVGGVFALTTSGAGTNLYGGNNVQNLHGRATEFDWVRGIPEHEADDWRHEAERRAGRELDAGEVSAFWMRETLRSVGERPLVHARILWNKLRLSLGRYEVPDNHDIEWDARHLATLRWPLPGWGLWGALGLAGIVAFGVTRRSGVLDRAGTAELAAFFLLYLATIVLTVTSMRIRVALVVPLLPFAGWFVDRALLARPRFAAWRRRLDDGEAGAPLAVLPASVALAVGLAFAWIPVFDAEQRAEDLDKRDFNLAVYLLEREDGLERAEEIARRLEAKDGRSSRVESLLASIALQRVARMRAEAPLTGERRAEAEALLREAMGRLRDVAENPGVSVREKFRARALAGMIQLEAGDPVAATNHFRAALEFDPEDADVLFGLATALGRRAADDASAARESLAILEELCPRLDSSACRELQRTVAAAVRASADDH